MTIYLVHFCLFWSNATPAKTLISSIYSPRELISRQKIDAKKLCKLMFGEYAKVHEENTTTNSMKPRTGPVICMGPTGNIQGSINLCV